MMGEPRFFSIRSSAAWRRGTTGHLSVEDDGLSIVRKQVYRPLRRDKADFPHIVWPIADAAVGRGGGWLLLDAAAGVWKADLRTGHIEALLLPGHEWFTRSASIAVTGDNWAAADPGASPTLVMLSLDNAQVLWARSEWNGKPISVLAVASEAEDRTVALAAIRDGVHEEEFRLLRIGNSGEAVGELPIVLPLDAAVGNSVDGTDSDAAGDAAGDAVADDAAAEDAPTDTARIDVDANDGDSTGGGVTGGGATDKAAGIEARRFELTLSAAGSGWLLDRRRQQIARFSFSAGECEWMPLPDIAVPALAVCAAGSGAVWIVRRDEPGAGRSLVLLSADGTARSLGDAGAGGADKLAPGPDNRLFVWENEEAVATTLQPVEETAVWEPLGRRMGVWISTSLDSTAIETEWHKIVLDAAGEPDTQILLRYYAADQPYAIVGGELVHLDRYIADPSIDAAAKLAGLRPLWSKPIVDPQDALLFDAKGQYLWLYMELIGSDAHSPAVYGIQVHFPRMSYVADLPALYQQDRQSKHFLDRFLSLFQTMMEQTDRQIAQLPRSFDPEAASGESLKWILRWLGLEADDMWSEAQLRDLLKQAPTLHRLRGTRYALETLLTVYTGDKPVILEYEQIRSLKENPEFSGVAEKLYDVETFGFNVLVKLEHADSEAKRAMLQHLIDRYKPAFATARLIVLQPWVYTDLHSYLGLNTVLSEPALLKLDGYSSMPHHTITIDVGQENRVDRHTRLELDSQLE